MPDGETIRVCPVCEGDGCECGNTGRKVRTAIDTGDGVILHVSGDAPLSDETRDALVELARLGFAALDARTGRGSDDA